MSHRIAGMLHWDLENVEVVTLKVMYAVTLKAVRNATQKKRQSGTCRRNIKH